MQTSTATNEPAAATSEPAPPSRRGRPPAASREDVLALAMHRYLRGRRVDVQAIASELGLGRTTIYRWFGSRDDYEPPVDPSTLGYAIVRLAEAFLFNDAVAGMRGDVERLREVEGALLGV